MDFNNLEDNSLEAIARAAPASMRVEMAKSAARDQDLRILKAMTSAGCFDFSPTMLEHDHQRPNRHVSYAKCEIPIIAAWACILENTSPVSKPIEHLGNGSGTAPPKVPRTFIDPVTEDFKSAFREMITKFAAGASRHLSELSKENHEDGLNLSVFETLLSLGAAACAMNDKKSVSVAAGTLTWMSKFCRPEDMPSHARLSPNVLGFDPDLTRKVKFGKEHDMHRSHAVRISPWTLALEFDAQDAWDVAAKHFHIKGLVSESARYIVDHDDGRPISAPELTAEGWMGASPEAWRQMMKGVDSDHPPIAVRDAISTLTVSAMQRTDDKAWLDAALDSGMQRFDPVTAVKTCMSRAHGAELLEKLRPDIPWETSHDEGHILFDLAVRARLYRRLAGTEVLTGILHMAKKDGHWESLLRATKPEKNKLGGSQDTVFENMAHHGCAEGVLTMLELGFDPLSPGPSGETALQRIQQKAEPPDGPSSTANTDSSLRNNNDALKMIRSWQAHKAAQKALLELQTTTSLAP